MKYGLTDSSSWRKRPTLLPWRNDAHALVRAFIDVRLIARRREFGIGLLVLQQHTIAIHDDVRYKAAAVRQRDAALLHGAAPGAAWRSPDRACGRRHITYLAMFTWEMSRASLFLSKPWAVPSCRQIALQRDARACQTNRARCFHTRCGSGDAPLVRTSPFRRSVDPRPAANHEATSPARLCLLRVGWPFS